MLLLDTSVWIEFFNSPTGRIATEVEKLIDRGLPVSINAVIEMELLQGIRDDENYFSMRTYLADFQYFPDLTKIYFDLATEVYRSCRKKGVTIRKSLDCVIAANCLIDGLEIVHHDRDFLQISSVFRELKVMSFD